MRKRFLSILLTCCMMLTLLPTVAFAEGTAAEVGTEEELTNALGSADTVKLKGNIDINNTLKINCMVTLDLNGHVLNMIGGKRVIEVESGGNLTLVDSTPNTPHKFTPNTDGLWVWDETNGTRIVKGGVITGGKATNASGGGVLVDNGGTFNMSGGSIVGCAAKGGGFAIYNGGGICNVGTTTLSGNVKIQGCYAKGGGGGIYSKKLCEITIKNVHITDCKAGSSNSSAIVGEGAIIENGTFEGSVSNRGTISGGVFHGEVSNEGIISGGAFDGEVVNQSEATISGGEFKGAVTNISKIEDGTFQGTVTNSGNGTIENGTFHGEVKNKMENGVGGTIKGGTFNSAVTNDAGATISGGTFNSAVTNHTGATISGGTFHGTLTNNGTIAEGTTFAVKFDANGGSDVKEQKVVNGQKATEPECTKTGYTLEGWYKGETKYTFTEAVTEPLTLMAKWTINQYTITFVFDNGTENKVITENYDTKITAPENPTKDGYIFAGWNPAIPTTMPAENMKITAQWRRKKSSSSSTPEYAVSVPSKSENGSVSISPKNAAEGERVTITVVPKKGYALDKLTALDKNGKEMKLKDKGDGKFTFTMPASKVEIKATFKEAASEPAPPKQETRQTVVQMQIGSRMLISDGVVSQKDAAPVIRNNRTLVPIRFITEALGGEVKWNEAAKEVILVIDGKEIRMRIGETLEKYGVAPMIIDGRTYVPVRFVADELHAAVVWNEAAKTVTITKEVVEKKA